MSNPLDTISQNLNNDMKAVNAIILKRMDSHVPLVKDLAAYLIAAGGKRIRPLLTLASTALYSGDMERAHNLASCVEFIHTATLLHDDVVDESDERRGKPAANTVFGNQASVLVGDFLFSRSFQMMTDDGSLDVLRILSDASAIIAQGEVMQLSMTGDTQMSFDNYLDIIRAKTAALFAAATEIGPVIANAKNSDAEAMAEYGLNLGIAFQISDDVLDYSATQEKLGKTIGDDFREGKMTLPIIDALSKSNEEEQKFWQRTIHDKNQSTDDLAQAMSIMEKHGSFEYSLNKAQEYAQKAQLALSEAPDSTLRAHMHDLVNFTVNREF